MSLEADCQTSARNSQEETTADTMEPSIEPLTEPSIERASSGSVNRRGLMKGVAGGILGALAVQEVLAPRRLIAAAGQPVPEPARTSASASTAGFAGVFDVKAFGATGDGKTIDTQAINNAIDAAVAAGGGTVRFSAGTYASFSIHSFTSARARRSCPRILRRRARADTTQRNPTPSGKPIRITATIIFTTV